MMNNIKSIISKLMITVVTCAICIVSGVPVHAEDIEYISEVKMAIAKSISDTDKNAAIMDLESNGYTVLKATSTDDYETSGEAVNINAGTDKVPVYLGYKTTTDSKEAITDLKMIEMAEKDDGSGAYSFTAYDEIVKKYKDNIEVTISSLKIGMAEFATNYDAGSPAAVWAYENLNRFYDPETDEQTGMGDIAVDFGRQVSEENEDTDLEERLTNYLLKSNTNFVNAFKSLIAVGCAEYNTDSTWIERFSEMDSKYDYRDRGYANMFDEAIDGILNSWDGFYSIFTRYKNAGLTADSTDEELQAYFDQEALNSAEGVPYSLDTFTFARSALSYLNKYEFDGKPMEEYFMQVESSDQLDKATIVPLLSSMTQGQIAMATELGIRGLFSILDNTEENWSGVEKSVENILNTCEIDTNGRASIYEGVNFSLYDKNGIALTSDAMIRQSTTSESPYTCDSDHKILMIMAWALSAASMSGSVVGFLTTKYVVSTYDSALNAADAIIRAKETNYLKTLSESTEILTKYGSDSTEYLNITRQLDSASKELNVVKNYYANGVQKTVSTIQWVGYGLSIALAVISIGLAAWGAYETYEYIQDYYHPSYTQIPGVMIDNLKLENTSGIVTDYYVYYNTVMYSNDGTDEPADTNGFTGKKWNAMFTTTDKNAGAPIVASTLCAQIGKSEKENYTSVTKFHQSNAYNLNAHQFTDNANGIYLFYQNSDNPNLVVGSVFSAGTIGGILAGTAGGVVIGALGMMLVQKKKKKEAEA